jgi:hypothetical protein
MMSWHFVGDEARWLLNSQQLQAFLAERGIAPTSFADIPVAAHYRRRPLYSASEALAYFEIAP